MRWNWMTMSSSMKFAAVYHSSANIVRPHSWPDVGLVPGILVIAAIVLWSPVPLRPVFFKDETWAECYLTLMKGLGVAALICILLVLYIIWVGLPIMAGMTYCSLTAQEPAKWGIIGTGIANGVWGPGAHYLFTKALDKVFPD